MAPVDPDSLRLGFAFSLGVATFFAPCAFPLLPGYVAFYVGNEDETPTASTATQARKALVVGLLASLGVVLVLGAIGVVASVFGNRILNNIAILEGIVGLLLVGVGTAMAFGRLNTGQLHLALPERRRGPLAYLAFGAIYAAAAAGCTAWALLGVAAMAATAGPAGAVATFGAYAAGMVVLLVVVTLLAALGRKAVLRHVTSRMDLISRAAGVVLVVAGLVQLYFYVVVFDGLAPLLG